ncbi:hypothetical protein TcasGA2_TC002255 [Tribolium castaneum]|uniref:Uncharacterized protein n=1 Tax=Tribolium castaneum TaxID=7070 RepID=D7EHV2_TRICA|nr:hypothetical protein TcasGA2_TC002255 [Tribolium castaneum]
MCDHLPTYIYCNRRPEMMDLSSGRMHALMVVSRGPLRARWVKEKRAHMFGNTSIYVRITTFESPLTRTRRSSSPGRFVPPADRRRLVRHLHNHGLQQFFCTTFTREKRTIYWRKTTQRKRKFSSVAAAGTQRWVGDGRHSNWFATDAADGDPRRVICNKVVYQSFGELITCVNS